MTHPDAASHLAAVLDAESDALEACDWRDLAQFLPRKEAAMAAFDAALADGRIGHGGAECLTRAATRNRTALLRALRIQGRVLRIVAEAARRASAGSGYGTRAQVQASGLLLARA